MVDLKHTSASSAPRLLPWHCEEAAGLPTKREIDQAVHLEGQSTPGIRCRVDRCHAHFGPRRDLNHRDGSLVDRAPSDDIRKLLREIRDLQKAHFERYVALTDEISASQKRAAEEAARARSEQDALLQSQQDYQDEMRRTVRDSQRQATLLLAILIGMMCLYGALSFVTTLISIGSEPIV